MKTLLCQNKSNIRLNSHPGVYNVTCGYDAVYHGELKKKVLWRTTEHQQDSCKGNGKVHGQLNTAWNVTENLIDFTLPQSKSNQSITKEK